MIEKYKSNNTVHFTAERSVDAYKMQPWPVFFKYYCNCAQDSSQ